MEGILIVGSTCRSGVLADLRAVAKDLGIVGEAHLSAITASSEPDDALYCEMSRLNNELVNAQRELAKKNADVEQRVEERTGELREMLSRVETEARIRGEAEERMRELSAQLLHLRDEERRRLARDLHDTTGQVLAALKMSLGSLHKVVGNRPPAEALFEELDALADQALKEIRTISHLLHPPLLEEMGFASAARWYVEGFSNRSQIQLNLQIDALGRFPESVELVFFRVLQEGLTNVLRHSGATRVEVRVNGGEQILLTIQDNGKGMPLELVEEFNRTGGGVGVGLAGMRERVRELGGKLTIQSDERGTAVKAAIPGSVFSAPRVENGAKNLLSAPQSA